MTRRIWATIGFAVLAGVVGAWWARGSGGSPAGGSTAPVVAPPVPDVDVVMVGDSLTAEGDWATLLHGVAVANRGVAGDTAADVAARMDGILATRPEVAFVMVGVNDAGRGLRADEILADYVEVVDALERAGIDVVIQSTIECRRSTCGGAVLEVIRDLNRKLEKLAADRGLDYVDLNRSLSNRAGLKTEYTYDGIHLDGDGYRQWAGALSERVRGIVPKSRSGSGGD